LEKHRQSKEVIGVSHHAHKLKHICYSCHMTKEIVIQHKSFSSFTSWLRCGKSWELARKYKAPEDPAWYFVGGSAFHLAAEKFLLKQFDLSNDKSDTAEIPF
jgi:hypothetical protein